MKALSKAVLAFLLSLTLVCPADAAANANSLQADLVSHYRGIPKLTTFWEAAALYGAGEELAAWNTSALTGQYPTVNQPTHLTSYILSCLITGKDPRCINGRDAVEQLAQMQGSDGGFHTYLNQHVWAMLALDAAKADYDREGALDYFSAYESGGGYSYTTDSGFPDPDMTAMALLVLGNYDEAASCEAAVTYLHGIQTESGGFEAWGTENSNTIAAVISGLVAAGEDIFDASWTKEGNTMLDALERFRLADGTFVFSLDEEETNHLATEQVFVAVNDVINGSCIWTSFDVPSTVELNLRIEGAEKRLLYDDFTAVSFIPSSASKYTPMTVFDAVIDCLEQAKIPYDADKSSKYIKEINGEREAMYGGWDGWQYVVNDTVADFENEMGMGSCYLSSGDCVTLYYGDFAPGTLYPSYTVSPQTPKSNSEFTVTVNAKYTDYSDYESPKNTVAAVSGATVEVDGVKYTTDKNGVATITEITKGGDYEARIYYEGTKDAPPKLVRTLPFTINVEQHKSIVVSSPPSSSGGTVLIPPAPAEEADVVYSDASDISPWAADYIQRAARYSIMKGDASGAFRPRDAISRAEFTVIVVNLLGIYNDAYTADFSDVSPEQWFFGHVASASSEGVVSGYPDGSFRPDSHLTREELAVIICRAFELEALYEVFADEESISDWAKEAVSLSGGNGILVGSDGLFLPQDKLTREMAATVAVRLYERFLNQ